VEIDSNLELNSLSNSKSKKSNDRRGRCGTAIIGYSVHVRGVGVERSGTGCRIAPIGGSAQKEGSRKDADDKGKVLKEHISYNYLVIL
jgi:hypothetical protein